MSSEASSSVSHLISASSHSSKDYTRQEVQDKMASARKAQSIQSLATIIFCVNWKIVRFNSKAAATLTVEGCILRNSLISTKRG